MLVGEETGKGGTYVVPVLLNFLHVVLLQDTFQLDMPNRNLLENER